LAFLALSAIRAQAPEPRPPIGTITSTTREVNVYATVHDKKGRLVSSLDKSDFDLRDDGASQQILYFSRETNVPLSLGVLIDTSPSQAGLLAKEQQAAKLFLRSVLHASDQAFVIHFDVDIEVLQDFTNSPKMLSLALDEMRINETGQSVLPQASTNPHHGATRLYDAVYLASNELMKTRYGRKVLVLVTDGQDQGSAETWKSALEAAEKADVIVYTVVITDPDFYVLRGVSYHGNANMRKLCQATGGRDIVAASIEKIGSAFDAIADELRSEYLLSYSPTKVANQQPFHEIRLGTPNHHYSVRARSGYFAAAE
jgi:VWFA-related protein